MKTTLVAKWIVTAGLFFGCNQQPLLQSENDKDDSTSTDGDVIVQDESPSDSSGSSMTVALDMKSNSESGLSLTEEPAAPTELKISDALTVSMARFNLWAIKVKSKKEQSDNEKKLEDTEKQEDKKDSEELEAEDGAGLKEDGDEPDSEDESEAKEEKDKLDTDMQDKIKDKIAEKRDHYKNKMEEEKNRDKARDKSRKFHGPFVYDAVAGAMEGDAPAVDLNDGSYRRIEFKLKRNVTAEETDPLLGNVFVIRGSLNKGAEAEAVPFEIDWHSAMNFRLRGEGAFKVEAEGDSKLAIVFDLGKWFDGIDMTTATVGADGIIHINKHDNKEIMKQLRRNIKVNTRFGKDKNGDGKIDESETAGQGEDTPDTED